MAKDPKSVAIVGMGPAGRALAGAFADAGFPVVAVCSRGSERLSKAIKAVGLKDVKGTGNAAEAAGLASIVVLAVPDKAIAEVASEIASDGGFEEGDLAVHLSGSLPSSVLEPAQVRGARVGSMHPIKSFAGVEEDRDFSGVCFGVEGQDDAARRIAKIVKKFDGISLTLRTEDKALYHLAASIVSNFTVSLFHQGLTLLEGIGVDRKTGLLALGTLLKGTVDNISSVGIPSALTGPIARGDVETVRAHLEALKEHASERLPLYASLARYTVEVALEKGSLHTEEAEVFKSMLARYM